MKNKTLLKSLYFLFVFQRIPLVSRTSISTDLPVSKPKQKAILKGKMDHSLEKVELNFETDEKLIMDTWQQASLAITHMVSCAFLHISIMPTH